MEKRQFIAGARCPECGDVDRIQRVDDGSRVWMHCVGCGMNQALEDPPADATPSGQDSQPVVIQRPPGNQG